MTEQELEERLKSLEFEGEAADADSQNTIDLENLDLCAPDNIRPLDMPYPDRANTMEDVSNIINGPDIQALLDTKAINANPRVAEYIKTKFDTPTVSPALLEIDTSIFDDIIKPFEFNTEDGNVEYDYPIDNYAIIEFGEDYTLGKAVEYELTIEPDADLNNKTILGSIIQDGKKKQIRSIFSKGHILKNPDDTFYHLFPDSCNKHIVLKDFEYGQGFDFDTSEIEVFQDKFIKNTMLYNLIKDNIVYSGLPDILLKREPYIMHFVKFHFCPFKYSHNIYDDYIEDFEDEYENKQKLITNAVSAEKLKATQGKVDKVNKCADELNAARDKFLQWVISEWRKAKNQPMCKYTVNEDDCRYLAQNKQGDFDVVHIGETKVQNYYANLLSRICLIYGDEWSQRYFNVISGIIRKRMSVEQYSITYLISEFNQLFQQNVSAAYPNPYAEIQAEFRNKRDLSYDDVYKWVQEKQGSVNSYQKQFACQQLANIYWFIIHYTGEDNESMAMNTGSNIDILDLVEEERDKLHNFWEEAIRAYYANPITKEINKFKEYAENLNPYADWPAPINIPIEGITYKLYTFSNPQYKPTPVPEPEEDIDLDNITEPQEPTDFPIPKEPSDDSNDPTFDEITIKDYDYWKRYFALATVISIPFLADGFDIPPTMTPIPLPCIYMCFNTIFIKQLNLVIVIGLALRGIWPWPVVLFVNCSSTPASYLTPLIAALQKLRELFQAKIEKIECTIPNLVQIIINKLEKENIQYRKTNIEYQVYIDILKNQRLENKELMKKSIKDQFNKNGDTRQVINRLEKLTQFPNLKNDK